METKIKQLEKILKDNTTYLADELDLSAIDAESFADKDELEEAIINYIIESVQVIYYSSAIKFLAENDNSLRKSLEIASEYGFELLNLNSETLATLLLQRYCLDEVSDFLNAMEEEGYFETTTSEE